jgi:hypothetical protein
MISRRAGRGRKKASALRSFTRQELAPLGALAAYINGDDPLLNDPLLDATHGLRTGGPLASGRRDDVIGRLRNSAAAIVTSVLSMPYPTVPKDAAERFNDLAARAPLYYVAERDDGARRAEHIGDFQIAEHEGAPVRLHTKTAQGLWALRLMVFLNNRHRDRLRSCAQCHRWFVDVTRNRSARRCTRKCTIAWSHAQRRRSRAAER